MILRGGRARWLASCGGYSLLECVLGLAFVLSASAVFAPMTAAAVEASHVRQAAGFLASRFRLARQQAAVEGWSEAIAFDLVDGRWIVRACHDGNGNGVRRAELGLADPCPDGPFDLESLFPRVRVERDPLIPDPGGQTGSDDPVRFGQNDVASFTPLGTATAGTIYLRSTQQVQYAVRVAGINGRTRILRYRVDTAAWEEL